MSVAIFQREPANCLLLSMSSETPHPETTIGLNDVQFSASTMPVYREVNEICTGYCLNGGQCIFDDGEIKCRYFIFPF